MQRNTPRCDHISNHTFAACYEPVRRLKTNKQNKKNLEIVVGNTGFFAGGGGGRGEESNANFICSIPSQAASEEARDRAAKGLPVKGSNFRPSKQVNEMLARYPQPESNLK